MCVLLGVECCLIGVSIVCVCLCTANNIGVVGAVALSQCLPHLTQLTQLDLRGEYAMMCVFMPYCMGFDYDTLCLQVQSTTLAMKE